MNKKALFFIKPFLWLLLICYGLYLPADKLPSVPLFNIPYFDKIVHFTMFFTFSLLLIRPFKRLNFSPYLWSFMVSIFLGMALESVQHLISKSRSTDFFDFLANSAGIIVSLIFFRFFVDEKKWEKLF